MSPAQGGQAERAWFAKQERGRILSVATPQRGTIGAGTTEKSEKVNINIIKQFLTRWIKLLKINSNMSGHSKWSTIKHKKALTDAKKSKVFSKATSLITIAARKGGDPDKNPSLRAVLEKAREINLPKENIERAIKRGSGEIAGVALEEVTYGAFGPGGVAILITAITDNKNRTLAEIKKILLEHNAKFAELNSIQWMFQRSGADWVANNPIKIEDENVKKELEALYEDLDDSQDVNEIYSNEL